MQVVHVRMNVRGTRGRAGKIERRIGKLRPLKVALCAGVSIGALFMATPALATEFFANRSPNECSEAEPCATVGKGVGTADPEHPGFAAEFQMGAFNVLCEKARTYALSPAEGAFTEASSETLRLEVKFLRCFAVARFGSFIGAIGASFNEGKPILIEYRPNEELSGGVEGGTVVLGEGRASLTIAHKICKMGWGGQVVKSKLEHPVASFATVEEAVKPTSRFPEGIRDRLEIANAFKGIQFEFEEGQCVGEGGFEEGAKVTEGKSGNFDGNFLVTLKGGSIGAE